MVALVAGYAGFYVCRSNLAVAAPLLAGDSGLEGGAGALGAMASLGILAYALGKPITGVAGDLLGGRWTFVVAMWGSVAATLAFSAGTSLSALTAIWAVNRFVQAAGWGAATKVVAQWFEPARHGRVAAILSLSFLLGDAAARIGLGSLLAAGMGWRGVFAVSALVLAVLALGVGAALRDRPSEVGLPDPPANPHTVYGPATGAPRPGVRALLAPFAASPSFWLVCALSSALTLVREAFSIWTPTFLSAAYAMPAGDAARWSAVFPLMGAVSGLAVGAASDRVGAGRRMAVVTPLLVLAALATFTAALGPARDSAAAGLALLGAIALLLIGPYSLLAGAVALELGGAHGAATAAGLIDTAGYLGALLSGVAIGAVADAYGWGPAFQVLGSVTLVAAAIAAVLARGERRAARRRRGGQVR